PGAAGGGPCRSACAPVASSCSVAWRYTGGWLGGRRRRGLRLGRRPLGSADGRCRRGGRGLGSAGGRLRRRVRRRARRGADGVVELGRGPPHLFGEVRRVERGAKHPRSDEQEELGLLDQPILEAEEVAEDRDVLQERNATV